MTYRDILPVWWSFFWRWLVGSMVAGFFLGALAGGLSAVIVGNLSYSGIAGAIAGWVSGLLLSIWALRASINKHHLHNQRSVSDVF